MYLLRIVQVSFLLLPVFSFGQLRLSQDTLLKMYDHQTIIVLSNGVMRQGQMQKRSLFSNPLKNAVRTDPTASATFERANLQLFGGGALVGIGSFPMVMGLGNLKGNLGMSQNEATAWTIGGAVVVGLGFWASNKAADGFYQTAWEYNRDALLQGLPNPNDSVQRAQILRKYEQNTIRRSPFGFYQNGRYEMTGLLGFDDPLKDRLRPNVAAYSLYKRGNRYRNTGRVLSYVSLVGSLYAFSKIIDIQSVNGKVLVDAFKISLVSGGLSILGGALLIHGEDETQRAVWFYNRDAFAKGFF